MLKRAVITIVFLISAIVAAGWIILSGQTFYADYVANEVGAAIGKMGGWELTTRAVSGNPITGVECDGVEISSPQGVMMRADSVSMRVDIVASISMPKLARMEIRGLSADLETIIASLPEETSGGDPAVESVGIADGELMTPIGVLKIEDAEVEISSGRYMTSFRGALRSDDISARVDVSREEGGGYLIRNVAITWGGARMRSSGAVGAGSDADLTIEASGITPALLSTMLDEGVPDGIDGEFALTAHAVQSDGLRVDAEVSSRAGSVASMDFTDLKSELVVSDDVIIIRSLAANALGGSISASGDLRSDADHSPGIIIKSLDIDVRGAKTNELVPLVPQIASVDAAIDLRAELSGPLCALNVRAHASSDKLRYDTFAFDDLDADVTVREMRSLHIAASARARSAPITARAEVPLTKGGKFGVNVEIKDAELAKFYDLIPALREREAKGRASVAASITGSLDSPLIRAKVSSPAIQLSGGLSLTDISSIVQLSGDAISIESGSANVAGHRIGFDGSARISDGALRDIEGRAGVRATELRSLASLVPDLGELDVDGQLDVDIFVSGSSDEPRVSAEIRSDAVSLMKAVPLKRASASLHLDGEDVVVDSLTAEFGSSPIAASGRVSTADGPVSFDIIGTIRSLDLAHVAGMTIDVPDISGVANARARAHADGGEPVVELELEDSRLRYADKLDLERLEGGATIKDGAIHIKDLGSRLTSGKISLSGTVLGAFSAKSLEDVQLDLAISAVSADVGRISRMFMPNTKGYEGFITGTLSVHGSPVSYRATADASLESLRAFGLFFPTVEAHGIRASSSGIYMPHITARVGRGTIDAAVSLDLSPEVRAEVVSEGRSVDIRALTFSLGRDVRRQLSGSLDFGFRGSGPLDSFRGEGRISVPSFEGMGVKISDLAAPIVIADGFVVVEDSTADAYGGTLSAQFAYDLARSSWGGHLTARSADFAAVYRDLVPDAEGTITGSADLTLRLGGDAGRTSMLDGDGQFDIRDGEITGFAATETIARLTAGLPIKFSSIHVPFHIDGRFIHLLPGTRISAPSADPLYRYAAVDGSIALDTMEASVSCIGRISMRALNMFIGGFEGLVNVAMDGELATEDILSNLLGGAISGFSKNSFRDVSFMVRAASDDVSVSKLEITAPEKFDTMPEKLSQSDLDKDSDENKFSLTVEIPVGPGGQARSDVAGQLSGQVLEQLLKGVFKIKKAE